MTKTMDSRSFGLAQDRFRGNDKLFVRAVGITLAAFFIGTGLRGSMKYAG